MISFTCYLVLAILFAILLPLAVWYLCKYLELPPVLPMLAAGASLAMMFCLFIEYMFYRCPDNYNCYWTSQYFSLQTVALALILGVFASMIHYLPEYSYLFSLLGAVPVCLIAANITKIVVPNHNGLTMTLLVLALLALTTASTVQCNTGNPLFPWKQISPLLIVLLFGLVIGALGLRPRRCIDLNVMITNVVAGAKETPRELVQEEIQSDDILQEDF